MGSAVEQANDSYLMPFSVMKHTDVRQALLQPCCYKNKHRNRGTERKSGWDVNSVP